MRRSSRLAVPLRRPEDVIPHLGKPAHWKQGRSAKALADAWFAAGDIAPAVRAVLAQSGRFADAELLDGWLERETDLCDGRGTASQTDLLALIGVGDDLAVLGIEAKVDESFGKPVSEWLTEGGTGKAQRLAGMRALLGIESAPVGHLRYQLFHRTAAVILEARRFRTKEAVLIVQSFCLRGSGLADARAFFDTIGLAGLDVGALVGPQNFDGVSLSVGWAADRILASASLEAAA
ncbi:hypothetical protein [Sphingomonas sp.]|uniref:DUF6946 family protein n=1 Tax=Sphingomonas sp. TaxID=28214 RepID=UPI0035BC586B